MSYVKFWFIHKNMLIFTFDDFSVTQRYRRLLDKICIHARSAVSSTRKLKLWLIGVFGSTWCKSLRNVFETPPIEILGTVYMNLKCPKILEKSVVKIIMGRNSYNEISIRNFIKEFAVKKWKRFQVFSVLFIKIHRRTYLRAFCLVIWSHGI
jgi:hypothetical protein